MSTRFSRQEYWSRLLYPPPGDRTQPRIELTSLAAPELQVDSLPLSHQGSLMPPDPPLTGTWTWTLISSHHPHASPSPQALGTARRTSVSLETGIKGRRSQLPSFRSGRRGRGKSSSLPAGREVGGPGPAHQTLPAHPNSLGAGSPQTRPGPRSSLGEGLQCPQCDLALCGPAEGQEGAEKDCFLG